MGESQLSLYLGRGDVNCWDVPIIIKKKKTFWETAGALISYLLSQYGSWIENWGTVGDALRLYALDDVKGRKQFLYLKDI